MSDFLEVGMAQTDRAGLGFGKSSPRNGNSTEEPSVNAKRCTEADVLRATWAHDPAGKDGKRYLCQATELSNYTTPLRWWDLRQYLEDYTSGNVTIGRLFSGFIYASYYWAGMCWRGRLGAPARRLYDRFQILSGGIPFPRRHGRIPLGQLTPTAKLNLQPGEWVRVKSYQDILATLDEGNKNRGLSFDAELVPFCGGTYRVRSRVQKFLNEKTGRLTEMKTPAVILESVWCLSRYSSCRMCCPRSIYSWWREIWLERVEVQRPEHLSSAERRRETVGASR